MRCRTRSARPVTGGPVTRYTESGDRIGAHVGEHLGGAVRRCPRSIVAPFEVVFRGDDVRLADAVPVEARAGIASMKSPFGKWSVSSAGPGSRPRWRCGPPPARVAHPLRAGCPP